MISEMRHFSDLIQLVQQGDANAFKAVMERYGDAIRREIRFILRDSRLRVCVGESDVLQSVALRFFVGMRDDQFDVRTPEDLVGLLKGIARNRVAELVRFWQAQRRDLRCNQSLPGFELENSSDENHQGLHALAEAELIEAVSGRLTQEERQILDWRDDGISWAVIAGRIGGSNESVRKRHERAMDRIANELKEKWL